MLTFPSWNDLFTLHTDVSMGGGAVSTHLAYGKEFTITFVTYHFLWTDSKGRPTERKYMAVLCVVAPFRHYLAGRRFIVVTDRSAVT